MNLSLLADSRLEVINKYIELGEVPTIPKMLDLEMKFTNNGNSPLYLTEVTSGCPCITTSFNTDAVLPGDTSSILIKLTLPEIGEFHKQINIYYNSETTPQHTGYCVISGEVIPKVDNKEETKTE